MKRDQRCWWKATVLTTAKAALLCVICLQARPQNVQKRDLQALKERLQRLEQEMQELKGEIDAAENPPATRLATAAGALTSPEIPPTENEKASTEQERFEGKI